MSDALDGGMPTEPERAMLQDLGARHGIWSPRAEPRVLGRGGENTTFSVGGCVVRRGSDPDAVGREVRLLRELTAATAVPTPVPLLHEPSIGVLAYRELPGTPLLRRRRRDLPSIVPALTDLLTALRRIPEARTLPVDAYPNEQWHRDAAEWFGAVRSHLGDARARRVQRFLDGPPPPDRDRSEPQHNDLGAEHILVDDDGRVTGVIDWTDAARTDPARDSGTLCRDLGSDAALRIGRAVEGALSEDDVARIRFHARCKWLEDASFALSAPARRAAYLDNAAWTFDSTFGASS